jgi:CheY-like chemotaxis protein
MKDKILIKLKGLLDNLSDLRDDESLPMSIRLSISECQRLADSLYEDLRADPSLELNKIPTNATTSSTISELKTKLLIVDDDEDTQKMLFFTLKRRGFEVLSELDPVIAFKKLEEINPKILLLDLMMPGMTGFEFLRHLQKHPLYGKLKVLVGSARNFEKDRISVLEEGAHGFIAKPYNINELILKLNSLLR